MKINLFLLLLFVSNILNASEFQNKCKTQHKDIDLSTCLNTLKENANNKLQERIYYFLDEAGDYTELKKEDFKKSHSNFNTYVKSQCDILLVLPTDVANINTVKDCEIKMIHNRINELNYIFSDI